MAADVKRLPSVELKACLYFMAIGNSINHIVSLQGHRRLFLTIDKKLVEATMAVDLKRLPSVR